jgi:ABC-type uncharacterized transport system substrate-binding protein
LQNGKARRHGSAARLGVILAAGLMAATPAAAHPHVFINGSVDFLFDDEGRLAQLRVTWDYDPMTSLFMLEDLGLDGSQPLSAEDRARLAAFDTTWDEGYVGDTYLRDGDRSIGLSDPRSPEAELRDGRVVIRFLRDVETRFSPGDETWVEMYDPVYYYAYTLVGSPQVENAPAGCRVTVEPFKPDSGLAALQRSLLELPADQTPDQAGVGALFTDKVRLECE